MAESAAVIVNQYALVDGTTIHTCDCNVCIFCQHLETNEAPGIDTFCKNNKRTDELREIEAEKRTRQHDSELAFQKGTICT